MTDEVHWLFYLERTSWETNLSRQRKIEEGSLCENPITSFTFPENLLQQWNG